MSCACGFVFCVRGDEWHEGVMVEREKTDRLNLIDKDFRHALGMKGK
jgi:hypothetical protein